MSPNKTLITGATGFVGSSVARNLLARGHHLRLLVRASSDQTNIAGLPAEIIVGDLNDKESLKNALTGVKYLFHIAADYRLWVPNPEAMMKANVDGTRMLMELAKEAGIERIVYCSSVAALATAHHGIPATEDDPITEDQIVGVYKKSKYRAQQEVLKMVKEEGLPAVIVNPSTPIGPRDIKPTPTGKMILDCVKGKMPAYVDTGLNIVHVDDVAQGHALAFEKGEIGQKYILGGDNVMLCDLFAMISKITGRKPPKIKINQAFLYPVAFIAETCAKLFHIDPIVTKEMLDMSKKLMFFSSKKAEKELGYHYRPAQEAVASAVSFFQDELKKNKKF